MDKQYIEDNEIRIKYLRKQLSAEETEAFEIYLMENPEEVEYLEASQIFEKALSDTHASAFGIPEALHRQFATFKFRYISVACLCFYGLGFMSNMVFEDKFNSAISHSVKSAQIEYVYRYRGDESNDSSEGVARFRADGGPDFVLVLPFGMSEQMIDTVRITKNTTDGEKTLYEAHEFQTNAQGDVVIMLPQNKFMNGHYKVFVDGSSSGTSPYSTSFSVEAVVALN